MEPGAQAIISWVEVAGAREQNVVSYLRKRRLNTVPPAGPAVVEKERCSVIDQPHPLATHQKVAVARSPIDVRNERVEPYDVRGCIGCEQWCVHHGIERERA